MIINLFKKIIKKYTLVKQKNCLKKHRISTLKKYHINYDPDFDISADNIKKMFHGYKTVILIPNPTVIADYSTCTIYYSPIKDWCEENCKDKFRMQLMPIVINETGDFIYDYSGSEELVIGFKNSEDAVLFLMTYDGPEMNRKGKFDVVKIN
jgi:hypothetical protein